MLLYQDRFTNDELFSDAFPLKVVDDIVIEVNCRMINISSGADIDIGANPSAEEQEESLEDGAKLVNDVVHSSRLQPTAFDKKSYLSYLKGYMKKVKKALEEEGVSTEAFEKGAQAFTKKIIGTFSDYEFYIASSDEAAGLEGMVALLNYREDGITPYFTFWKDGLKTQKL